MRESADARILTLLFAYRIWKILVDVGGMDEDGGGHRKRLPHALRDIYESKQIVRLTASATSPLVEDQTWKWEPNRMPLTRFGTVRDLERLLARNGHRHQIVRDETENFLAILHVIDLARKPSTRKADEPPPET